MAWLQTMMNRKAQETAVNAGWEYLKWAGRVSSADPRPPDEEILSDLQGFANGTLQPSGYMFGTAENSDSGYCDYLPPAGFESEYDGNASTARHQRRPPGASRRTSAWTPSGATTASRLSRRSSPGARPTWSASPA